MREIAYTDAHQAISILHSVVCISARYWGNDPEPKEGDEFKLNAKTKKSSEKFPQTSTWKIEGPVWKIDDLDPGCVSFFKSLWPFKDKWINSNDTLFCFKALGVDTIQMPHCS